MGTPTYGFDNVGDGITVGTYRINVSGLANSNYAITYSSGTNRGLLTITTRAVTVTADPQTKVYGDSDPALTYQITSGSLACSDDVHRRADPRCRRGRRARMPSPQGTLAPEHQLRA